ncbi:hypothetical protein B0A55_11454 [Friedmanniomyces simplex]|uniref:SH3 domain-containing protein n=1 Tax=Friedmanniomyces simplex TaxID=329884 RepID=A0A4U0WCY7_9PEZI|nr:hypothetical protein B0A55_11454 [Friedmanniomyces simplex]
MSAPGVRAEDITIASRTRECLKTFDALSRVPVIARDVADAVKDNLARFRIWAGNIGAYHSPHDKRSADYRLRDGPEVRAQLIELLDELIDNNHEIAENIPSTQEDPGPGTSTQDESYIAANDGSDINEVCLIAGDVITSLLKVSVLVRNATTRDRYARAAAASQTQAFIPDFDIRHVKDEYPKVGQRPWLAKRLGTAITQRRQFLRYCEEHSEKIARESRGLPETTATLAVSQFEPSISHASRVDGLSLFGALTVAETTASTVDVARLQGINLRPAHLDDTDAQSENLSYISSQSSLAVEGRLQVVRLDNLSTDGVPFECPYCHGIVSMRSQGAWKKHVFRDLRAYVCTFKDCKEGLFEDRQTWFEHELSRHRRHWICLSCPAKAFDSATAFREHLQRLHNHPQDGLTELVDPVLEASSRSSDRISVSDCPFCDTWEQRISQNTSVIQKSRPEMGSPTVDARYFRRHVAEHQEQLALSALPINFNDDEPAESDEETESDDDVSVAGEELEGAKKRQAKLRDEIEAQTRMKLDIERELLKPATKKFGQLAFDVNHKANCERTLRFVTGRLVALSEDLEKASGLVAKLDASQATEDDETKESAPEPAVIKSDPSPKATFYLDLRDPSDPSAKCPTVVRRCVEFLLTYEAEKEEGIFRFSGDKNKVKHLKDLFEVNGDANLVAICDDHDVLTIAELLRRHIREIPHDLLTVDLRPELAKCLNVDGTNGLNDLQQLRSLVKLLPSETRLLLRSLFFLLSRVVANSDVNGMGSRNISIFFTSILNMPMDLIGTFVNDYEYIFYQASASEPDSGLIEANRNLEVTAETVKRVRALYDFVPTEPGELEFKQDDIIEVTESAYKDWWKGRLDSGETGIFPLNYVEKVREVRALYDFVPTEVGELAFRTGDTILVLESIYKDWWRGKLRGGETGVFPVNYVEELGDFGQEERLIPANFDERLRDLPKEELPLPYPI